MTAVPRTARKKRCQERERKQYPALNAYWQGSEGKWVLSEAEEPVVLIVEDEFLLRMEAADMVEGRRVQHWRASHLCPDLARNI